MLQLLQLPTAALLLLFCSIDVARADDSTITDDSFFYGLSDPVYPSPKGTGAGDWADAYSKAGELVGQMTIEEKANLTVGVHITTNGCTGFIPSIPRLGFPGLCFSDAENGVREAEGVSGWSSQIHSGASWNRALNYQRGHGLGGEFLGKGINVMLGPVVGPIGRLATGGRNWEGFSNDPYLAGQLVAETVRGVQDRGVMTTTKHFIGNEQELDRLPANGVSSVSSNIDDKTMHELYLWPFADAVHAGSANIMCSYQRINNSFACQNSKTLNGLLKTELGFQGFVVSDWGGQQGGYTSAEAGLDMAMPQSDLYWAKGLLTTSIQNGSLPESRLDDMATRILAPWFKLNQNSSLSNPGFGLPPDLTKPHKLVDARDPAAQSTLFQSAVEGHVLVKNDGILPLNKPKFLAIFGYDAKAADSFDIGLAWQYGGFSSSNVTVLQALGLAPGVPQIGMNGTLTVGGGSGGNSPAYISSPFDALTTRARADNTLLLWDFASPTPVIPGAVDACLVFINALAGEGNDRTALADDYSDALVNSVADTCNNTIVTIHNAGIRLVDNWIEHPNVSAVVYAHLPGQDTGDAIVSLLYGDENFSGKLPYTVAKQESDYASLLTHSVAEAPYENFPQSEFLEGIFVDYRYFDKFGVEPRYEFGYGLSYTTFGYSNLAIAKVASDAQMGEYPSGGIVPGGQADLWDALYHVSCTVKNEGKVVGKEIAQLYIGFPEGDVVDAPTPVRVLRGFEKVEIQPGQSVTVGFDLTRRDLSRWDLGAQKWRLDKGEQFGVYVGASSRGLRLEGVIMM